VLGKFKRRIAHDINAAIAPLTLMNDPLLVEIGETIANLVDELYSAPYTTEDSKAIVEIENQVVEIEIEDAAAPGRHQIVLKKCANCPKSFVVLAEDRHKTVCGRRCYMALYNLTVRKTRTQK